MRNIIISFITVILIILTTPEITGGEKRYLFPNPDCGITSVYNMKTREGFVIYNPDKESMLVMIYPDKGLALFYTSDGKFEMNINQALTVIKRRGSLGKRMLSKTVPIEDLV